MSREKDTHWAKAVNLLKSEPVICVWAINDKDPVSGSSKALVKVESNDERCRFELLDLDPKEDEFLRLEKDAIRLLYIDDQLEPVVWDHSEKERNGVLMAVAMNFFSKKD
jgi:hypothetical protein